VEKKGEFLWWYIKYIKYIKGVREFLMCIKCLEKQRCEIYVKKEETCPKGKGI